MPVLRIFPDIGFYFSKAALTADNIFTHFFQPKKEEMPPFAQRRYFPVRGYHSGLIIMRLLLPPRRVSSSCFICLIISVSSIDFSFFQKTPADFFLLTDARKHGIFLSGVIIAG